jgi:hypothetical protein
VHDSRSDRPDTLLDEGRAARLGGLVDGEKRTFRRRKLIGSDSTRAKYSPPCPGIISITRAAATPHRHSPCWSMRCATGVSAVGVSFGEILNEEFLKPLGLMANALAFCRDDCSTTRRLDGGAGYVLSKNKFARPISRNSFNVEDVVTQMVFELLPQLCRFT